TGMKKQTRKSWGNLAAVIALFLAALAFSSYAQSNKMTASGKQTKKPLNQINPAYVITPKEATEWHAHKDKLGPALSGNLSWRNYMEFVEKKLKEYGAVDVMRNTWTYDRWSTSEWPDDSKWSLVSDGKKVKVSSYGCYSGSTSEEGLTAELVYYDAANPP